MNWRERLSQQPSLQQFENWPVIAWDALSKKQRSGFSRNQRILQSVLDGCTPQQAAVQSRLSQARVCQLLNRCLGGDEGEPALTLGLIPYAAVTQKKRKSPLPKLTDDRGTSCAFVHCYKLSLVYPTDWTPLLMQN